MPTVLFLCTGNYYRSRFAEVYFNWLAARDRSEWRADSRGLALIAENEGPLSQYTIEALARRGIPLPAELRLPRDLDRADLAAAGLVIAVKEHEHRPLMTRRFPDWAERIEYWHVHDLDCAAAEQAIAQLERHVLDLFARLHTNQRALA